MIGWLNYLIHIESKFINQHPLSSINQYMAQHSVWFFCLLNWQKHAFDLLLNILFSPACLTYTSKFFTNCSLNSIFILFIITLMAAHCSNLMLLLYCWQFVPAFVMPTALWLLGNILHLTRSNDFNTYPRYNVRINHHLRADAWFQLLVGVAWLAFPGHLSPLLVSFTPMIFSEYKDIWCCYQLFFILN